MLVRFSGFYVKIFIRENDIGMLKKTLIRSPFLKLLIFDSSTKLQKFFVKFALLTSVKISDARKPCVNHTEILKNLILYTSVVFNINEMAHEQRMVVSGVCVKDEQQHSVEMVLRRPNNAGNIIGKNINTQTCIF